MPDVSFVSCSLLVRYGTVRVVVAERALLRVHEYGADLTQHHLWNAAFVADHGPVLRSLHLALLFVYRDLAT